jgi:hypothetical protein
MPHIIKASNQELTFRQAIFKKEKKRARDKRNQRLARCPYLTLEV